MEEKSIKRTMVTIFYNEDLIELEDEINEFLSSCYRDSDAFELINTTVSQCIGKSGLIRTTILVTYKDEFIKK